MRSSVSIVPCALIQARVISFVSIGLSKPGIATIVAFPSSSSIDCSIAFSLASAIASFLFAVNTALSHSNLAL